ncbi:hypothetical protein EDC18_106114 [Natranaerovirga pectinivora]|uniref:Serine aminopeptidase S33 domain-containing protein n=1 Tax=Natranaerovirga pectinivora TaxID=682400 RepID=A0A4R3MJS9_9FIRM|nr:alpha/beta hydrolase [Natranaerovirga pectinivora]TCT14316.1 hypothetical protein EDC18_106114 [Natranaerovirga pectinivora]
MKDFFLKFIWVLFLPLSVLYMVAFVVAKKIICPPLLEYNFFLTEDIKEMEFDKNKKIMDFKPDTFFLSSTDGKPLRCRYYNFEKNKVIIMCHGWTANMCNYLKHIPLFYSLGYNVLLYDQRYHGESGGKCTTFGYHEKNDLGKIVRWVEENKKPQQVGLYGKSMGAATIIQYLAITDKISFAIVDCPYSDLCEQFTSVLKRACPYLPPRLMLLMGNIFFRLKGNFNVKSVSPIQDIKKIDIPMLFIHGANDCFVPPEMSKKLYEAKKDKKHLLIVSDAPHADSYNISPKLYENIVKEFLNSYDLV